ncbi:MAG: endonuclease/exonuclease/phosphatase family protein [Flavobacteriales bacterium]|nr:endonuclease/exonuclease/phosphatase family protein [Flavobacteriales bacterium]MCB9166713.1 endonuclease/exonuclease/phosphatase family protein [Flavobacteriales bacterium]
MTKLRPSAIPFLTILLAPQLHAQDATTRYQTACIGFYNLENLFDTIDSPDTDDKEFLPNSAKQWTSARYHEKLEHMARVIAEIATDIDPDGVRVLGVSEVENRGVLDDLVRVPTLAERGYRVVHKDSPDRRGVDVGLLYDPKHFTFLDQRSYVLSNPEDTAFRTRSQLLVKGVMDGDTIHVIVAHWPSRRGGEARSRPLRILAGQLGRHIVDSLLARDPEARIFYMGDLNDDPVDKSLRMGLGVVGDKRYATNGKMFDPMMDLYNKGIGSLAWRDSWNLFDQIAISPGAVAEGKDHFHYYGVRVFNQPYLRQNEGNFTGYPFRTFVGDNYMGGYSDHFPVYVVLVRPDGHVGTSY